MNPATATRLRNLNSDHPEWQPWLAVVEPTLVEAAERRWEEFVPSDPLGGDAVPILAESSIVLPSKFLQQWLKRLVRTAAAGGTPEMASLHVLEKTDVEAGTIFRAALTQDGPQLQALALDCGADPNAFRSVAQLLPVPFLHACNRLLASAQNESWTAGYCPLCGAWPAFAEVRGIERLRYHRCGRCGGQWQAHPLRCLFCNMDDHEQLLSLVPQNDTSSTRLIEACKHCSGYLKSFTTLQGSDPLAVALDDLASVDLDIAAVEQGFRRPDGPGYPLNTTVSYSRSKTNRILRWSR